MPGYKIIDYLYMSALARRPTKDELELAQVFLNLHEQDSTAALSDVWWLVLNSSEFIFNH